MAVDAIGDIARRNACLAVIKFGNGPRNCSVARLALLGRCDVVARLASRLNAIVALGAAIYDAGVIECSNVLGN